MNQSESITKLTAAMVTVQGQLKGYAEDSTNPHFKSKYATLGNVIRTLKRILPEAYVKEKSKGEHFLTGPQADAILTMQLQRLTGLEIEKLAKEYADLTEQIEGYEAILASE